MNIHPFNHFLKHISPEWKWIVNRGKQVIGRAYYSFFFGNCGKFGLSANPDFGE
jgi:hypothetical protein